MIVVDASVLANALGDDEADGIRARGELSAARELAGPDLVDVETVAVLRKRWLGGSLTAKRFAVAVDDLADITLTRYSALPFMQRAYELRSTVTTYDAVYVALAEGLDCELLTADDRLSRASGVRCAIRALR